MTEVLAVDTAITIIIAVIGSTGLATLIQFLISRHDKKHDRLGKIEQKLDKTERDSVRMQLLFMLKEMPEEKHEIMTLAQYYFSKDKLAGNWYMSSLFAKYMDKENIAKPIWFDHKGE